MKYIIFFYKKVKWYIMAFPLIYACQKTKLMDKLGLLKKYTIEEFIEELSKNKKS